jgi:chromosome segregation ATPase
VTARIDVNVEIECDECGADINDGEAAYCKGCFRSMSEEFEAANNKVGDLDEQLADAEIALRAAKQEAGAEKLRADEHEKYIAVLDRKILKLERELETVRQNGVF